VIVTWPEDVGAIDCRPLQCFLAMRTALADDYAALAYLNAKAVGIEVLLAVAATIVAGLYPTWRAAHVEPALQLKAE